MFARGAVDVDAGWTERLKNFFQALTQAATKVDRCAVVASLLATDPRMAQQTVVVVDARRGRRTPQPETRALLAQVARTLRLIR